MQTFPSAIFGLKALAKREHTVSFFCVSFYIDKFLIIFVNIQIYSCLLV